LSDVAVTIANHFLVKDYKWRFDYGLANPDEDDVEKVINRAMLILDAEIEPEVQLEVGRLMFKKRENGIVDIFMLAGTMGEVNEDSKV